MFVCADVSHSREEGEERASDRIWARDGRGIVSRPMCFARAISREGDRSIRDTRAEKRGQGERERDDQLAAPATAPRLLAAAPFARRLLTRNGRRD